MRVMVFEVGLNGGSEVAVREIFQYWYALVYLHIVKHKIGCTIKHDTYPDAQHVAIWRHNTKVDK